VVLSNKERSLGNGDLRKQTSLQKLRKLLGEGPRMIPHSALSDDIAGEELQLVNERLMQCNFYADFTIFSGINKRNYKRLSLTKVFAELCPLKCAQKATASPRGNLTIPNSQNPECFLKSHTIKERSSSNPHPNTAVSKSHRRTAHARQHRRPHRTARERPHEQANQTAPQPNNRRQSRTHPLHSRNKRLKIRCFLPFYYI